MALEIATFLALKALGLGDDGVTCCDATGRRAAGACPTLRTTDTGGQEMERARASQRRVREHLEKRAYPRNDLRGKARNRIWL